MVKSIQLGDYVVVGDEKGQIVGGETDKWVFQPLDTKKASSVVKECE